MSDLVAWVAAGAVVLAVVGGEWFVRRRDREMVARLRVWFGEDVEVCVTDWRCNDFRFRAVLGPARSDTKVWVRPADGRQFTVPASRILWAEHHGVRVDTNAVRRSAAARRATIGLLALMAIGTAILMTIEIRQDETGEAAMEAAGGAVKGFLIGAVLGTIWLWRYFEKNQ